MRPQLVSTSRTHNNTAHSDLIKQIRLALSQMPGVVAWQLTQGAGKAEHMDHTQWFGLVRGASDILCCARGKFIAIEIKTGRGREREEQQLFRACVESCGGVAIVAHSVEDAVRAVTG